MRLDEAAKLFSELEFFNPKFMAVTVSNKEIIVFLYKRVITTNLPQDFEGFPVVYQYTGKFYPK